MACFTDKFNKCESHSFIRLPIRAWDLLRGSILITSLEIACYHLVSQWIYPAISRERERERVTINQSTAHSVAPPILLNNQMASARTSFLHSTYVSDRVGPSMTIRFPLSKSRNTVSNKISVTHRKIVSKSNTEIALKGRKISHTYGRERERDRHGKTELVRRREHTHDTHNLYNN